MDFAFEHNKLTAADEDGNIVSLPVNSSETPNNPDKMKENFTAQIKKTGESDFYVQNIEINGSLPFLPVSKINELRRSVLAKLMEERLKITNEKFKNHCTILNFRYLTSIIKQISIMPEQKDFMKTANVRLMKCRWKAVIILQESALCRQNTV